LSYLAPFLRYGDLLAENCVFFLPLSYLASPLPIFPLEFCGKINHMETRVMGLLCGERCMILTSTVFDWSTRVTDRQTDGRAIAYTRYSIYAVARKNETWQRNIYCTRQSRIVPKQRWNRVTGSAILAMAGSGRVTGHGVWPDLWPGFEFYHLGEL